ncbi:MAG: hypothetical protein RRC07_16245 [Anaerolineae bacterium]|nr:hypothetical protein [Anaerolineae bacterium]
MITTPDGRPDKYAQIERERRYLLRRLPPSLEGSTEYLRIIDRYLPDSALRLRRMETADGRAVSFKLARKWSRPDLPPEETVITNLYLTPEEYEMLARLPAATLRKRRYPFLNEGIRFSIVQFEGPLDGLILAEMHLFPDTRDVPPCPLPDCIREVTADPSFTGGALAELTAETFQSWLAGELDGEEDTG